MGSMIHERNFRQCPNCHNQNAGDNAFCCNCGFPLTAPAAVRNPDNPRNTTAPPTVPAVTAASGGTRTLEGTATGPAAAAPGRKRRKGPLMALAAILATSLVLVIILAAIPAGRAKRLADRYETALSMMERQDYIGAERVFLELEDYEDAARQAERCRDYLDYQDALDLMEAGAYENALSAFEALRTFEDAASLAKECRNHIRYAAAAAMMESGDYEGAMAAFEALADFEDSSALLAECRSVLAYAAAEEAFDRGRYYDAWEGFSALGTYRDAAARAADCRQPYPDDGELYHNANFSDGVPLTVITDASRAVPTYLKVYTGGDELVSCVFLNIGAAVTVWLPSDLYRFKTAAGEYWYGEEQMFGDDGYYQSLLFDGNEDIVYIDAGSGPYELTLGGVVDGNVGSRNIDPEDF